MILEEIKQFLKPDWRKIALTFLMGGPAIGAIFSGAGAWWLYPISIIISAPLILMDQCTNGFLFHFCYKYGMMSWVCTVNSVLVVIIFYYLASCLLIHIYNKLKIRE